MDTQIDILTLRERISEEEFDYQTLLHALREYSRPRNRITTLLREGDIIRVKKGIYVFGQRLRRRPVSRELLSNLLYGPSYVSREYALRYHGLIPEEVYSLTAVTTGRSRSFRTPLGLFDYAYLPLSAYVTGITLATVEERNFFIASPEKALTDLVHMQRGLQLRSAGDVERFLFDNLRIDADDLQRLNPIVLQEISETAASRRVRYLTGYLLRNLALTRTP
jgi:predicted transcriptional regulator of viral defense system